MNETTEGGSKLLGDSLLISALKSINPKDLRIGDPCTRVSALTLRIIPNLEHILNLNDVIRKNTNDHIIAEYSRTIATKMSSIINELVADASKEMEFILTAAVGRSPLGDMIIMSAPTTPRKEVIEMLSYALKQLNESDIRPGIEYLVFKDTSKAIYFGSSEDITNYWNTLKNPLDHYEIISKIEFLKRCNAEQLKREPKQS